MVGLEQGPSTPHKLTLAGTSAQALLAPSLRSSQRKMYLAHIDECSHTLNLRYNLYTVKDLERCHSFSLEEHLGSFSSFQVTHVYLGELMM